MTPSERSLTLLAIVPRRHITFTSAKITRILAVRLNLPSIAQGILPDPTLRSNAMTARPSSYAPVEPYLGDMNSRQANGCEVPRQILIPDGLHLMLGHGQ